MQALLAGALAQESSSPKYISEATKLSQRKDEKQEEVSAI